MTSSIRNECSNLGMTAHFIDDGVDGPIILQVVIPRYKYRIWILYYLLHLQLLKSCLNL